MTNDILHAFPAQYNYKIIKGKKDAIITEVFFDDKQQ